MNRTLAVWKPRYAKELTQEEGKEIMANLAEFFDLLLKWGETAERQNNKQRKGTNEALAHGDQQEKSTPESILNQS